MSSLWQLESELKRVVGAKHVLSAEVDLALYECDAETLDVARPDLVVLPASSQEVQAVVALAGKYRVPLTPRGAGTGLSGGATCIHGGISLVLTRMARVLEVDADEMLAHVQVGVTNSEVSRQARPFGLYFAPDPSSQMASTIGGNIAENAGGAHTLKYGLTARNVLGAKVVLADGSIICLGGPHRTGPGLDLLGVILGSEGTLAIVTEAYLALSSLPESTETMLAYFPTLEAGGQTVSDIIAHGVIPAAMEMIDRLSLTCVEQSLSLGLNLEAGALLIVELDGPKAGIEEQREVVEKLAFEHGALEIKWAADEGERARIWKARKSAFGALGRIAPHGYVLDGVIPRSKLKQAITAIDQIGARYGLPISNIYHAGDGNLHPALLYHRDRPDEVKAVLKAAREILELCVELGGTLSGEHGIGIEKVLEMPVAFAPEDLECMARLKRCFNPVDLLNPGKVLPAPSHCGESGRRALLRHQLSAC